jgi:hypothetical protein
MQTVDCGHTAFRTWWRPIKDKTDLAARRVVTPSEAEELASVNHFLYTETSAKAGQNIREGFVRVAAAILGRMIVGGNSGTSSTPIFYGTVAPGEKLEFR